MKKHKLSLYLIAALAVMGCGAYTQAEAANTADAMHKAAGELTAAGDRLAAVHADAVRSITDELNTTLDAYRDYVNQFTQRVDYLCAGISDSVEKLPHAVNDSANQFLDQVDRIGDTLMEAQRALDAAVARLYGEARPRP